MYADAKRECGFVYVRQQNKVLVFEYKNSDVGFRPMRGYTRSKDLKSHCSRWDKKKKIHPPYFLYTLYNVVPGKMCKSNWTADRWRWAQIRATWSELNRTRIDESQLRTEKDFTAYACQYMVLKTDNENIVVVVIIINPFIVGDFCSFFFFQCTNTQ